MQSYLRELGYNKEDESPDQIVQLAQARQQTDGGHGGQLGQTMRKLLALVDAIAAKVT